MKNRVSWPHLFDGGHSKKKYRRDKAAQDKRKGKTHKVGDQKGKIETIGNSNHNEILPAAVTKAMPQQAPRKRDIPKRKNSLDATN